MTLHKSLKISAGLTGERNVWTRKERIERLRTNGRWKDGDSVLALPKVRTRFKTKAKKKEAKPAEGAAPAAAAGTAAPAAATPGGKGAAPAAKTEAKPAEKGKK